MPLLSPQDGAVKVTVEPGDVRTMLQLLGFSDNFVTSTTGPAACVESIRESIFESVEK